MRTMGHADIYVKCSIEGECKRYGGIIKTGFNRFFATSIIKRYVAAYECAYLLISRIINSKTNTKLKQRNQV